MKVFTTNKKSIKPRIKYFSKFYYTFPALFSDLSKLLATDNIGCFFFFALDLKNSLKKKEKFVKVIQMPNVLNLFLRMHQVIFTWKLSPTNIHLSYALRRSLNPSKFLLFLKTFAAASHVYHAFYVGLQHINNRWQKKSLTASNRTNIAG